MTITLRINKIYSIFNYFIWLNWYTLIYIGLMVNVINEEEKNWIYIDENSYWTYIDLMIVFDILCCHIASKLSSLIQSNRYTVLYISCHIVATQEAVMPLALCLTFSILYAILMLTQCRKTTDQSAAGCG